MIGSLRGRLVDRSATGQVVVEVGGVGYRATVSPATMVRLGPPGTEVLVHTHLHVREDALTLFAFTSSEERDCFEALIGAHGVGPALALAILSVHGPAELRRVLVEGDRDALTLVPGVGPKTATRLLLELKSRLELPEPAEALADGHGRPSARVEVRTALAALGYQADEITEVVRQLPSEGEVEELLRSALRQLAGAR